MTQLYLLSFVFSFVIAAHPVQASPVLQNCDSAPMRQITDQLMQAIENNNHGEVIRLATCFLSMTESDAVYLARAMSYFLVFDFESAYADIDRILSSEEDNAFVTVTAYTLQASINNIFGRYTPALESYDQALAILNQTAPLNDETSTSIAQLLARRALIYIKLEDLPRALLEVNRAIETDPENAAAYVVRGMVYSAYLNAVQARVDWERAVTLDPNVAEHWTTEGQLYMGAGDYMSAIDSYSTAIALRPRSAAQDYYGRGLAYFMLGLREQANDDFSIAVMLSPYPNIRLMRGINALLIGDLDHAVSDLSRYLEAR